MFVLSTLFNPLSRSASVDPPARSHFNKGRRVEIGQFQTACAEIYVNNLL